MSHAIRLPLLDPDQCEEWVLRLMLLRRNWRQRHAIAPFFTLGLAAYLDAGLGGLYHQAAQRQPSNQLLRRHFGQLLQRVAEALAGELGQAVRLAGDEAALPGFHIYLPHPAFGQAVAIIHRDLQHRDVFGGEVPPEAEAGGDGLDRLLSFTLALSAPAGSGLALWPAGPAAAAATATAATQPDFLAYHEGELLLHDGLCQHQAVLACTGPLERITLQGHGIRRGRQWLLYW